MSFPTHPLISPLLTIPAALYGAVMRHRNRRYDRPGASTQAQLPVISIGNITVGGTGKTPATAWLARDLLRDGRAPAIVSRGYGGKAGRGPLVVSKGQGPLVTAELSGDEPRWLAEQVPGVRVVVGSDRIRGAEEAQRIGADLILLDDGFQHRRLARDLDLVLVDAREPLGNEKLLPAGPLRESPAGLARAGAIVVTRLDQDHDIVAIADMLHHHAPSTPIFGAQHTPTGFVTHRGETSAAPQSAVAFCGIGRPESFRESLVAAGVDIVQWHAFGDHHTYTGQELDRLAHAAGDVPLVTTEKDLARIGAGVERLGPHGLLALRVKFQVAQADELLAIVYAALEPEV